MLLKLVNRGTICRLISTSAVQRDAGTVDVAKRDEYYKSLWANEGDTGKPAGWDEALPYEAIPGPKPLPLIGNMWRFLPVVGEYYNLPMQDFYRRLNSQYGEVVNLRGIIGRKPIVLLYNVNDTETYLRTAGQFPIRYGLESFIYYRTVVRDDIFQGVGGILTVQGEEWFKFRSTVNPILMQPRTAQQYVGPMDQVAAQLVENIRYFSEKSDDNEMPPDFLNELYKWSLESMGVIALNKHFGCLNLNLEENSEPRQFVGSVIQMFELMYTMDVLPPVWKLFSTPSWRRYVKILDFMTQMTLKYTEEGLAKAVKNDVPDHELSVLQRLAKVDKKVAVAMVMDMLIAGVDTTGRTLGAALYFLAKNPDKQECLRQEVLKNLPEKDSPVTKEVLNNSPYLKAVIKETTRITPVALAHLRTSIKDLVLGGYRIPKDTEVVSVHITYSMSEKEFKDPQKFIPERFLRTENDVYSYKNAHPFAFLPFGFGARSCIGKRLANLELEVALLKIIRNFQLSWPHEDMKFSAKFLYGIASPLKLKVQPVQQ